MPTTFVDSVMKKVEKKHRLEFLINADRGLSMDVANRIRKKWNNRFNGYNGHYHANNRMYVTDAGRRENNTYVLNRGGIVFGPYQEYMPGTYYVTFSFEAKHDCCVVLEISSGTHGVFTSETVNESGKITVEFILEQVVSDMEFKLTNLGDEEVVFHMVDVTDHYPITAEESLAESIQAAAPILENTDEINADLAELTDNVSNISEYVKLSLGELEASSRCELPVNTKMRFIKRVIRKLIKCYTRVQMEFNEKSVELVRRLHQKTNLLANTDMLLWGRVESMEKQMSEIRTQMNAASERLQTVQNAVKDYRNEISKQHTLGSDKALKIRNEVIEQVNKSIQEMQQKQQSFEEEKKRDNKVMLECIQRQDETIHSYAALVDLMRTEKPDNEEVEALKAQMESLTQSLELLRSSQAQLGDSLVDQEHIWKKTQEFDKSFENCWKVNESVTREISNLWEKAKAIDQDFRNEWQQDRRFNEEINQLWNTYSILRREVFYEIDYRIRRLSNSSQRDSGTKERERLEPQIKKSAKEAIAASHGLVKLNIGCGQIPMEGYINVDARDLPGVDVIADVQKLPYQEESVDEIYSAHLIEHFEISVMKNELLPYWVSLLKQGGVFRIVFPDAAAMIEDYNSGKMTFEDLSYVIMGGQDYDKDYHYTMYDTQKVIHLLENAGLKNIYVVASGRLNGGCRETEITAVK